jgi:PhnB protein
MATPTLTPRLVIKSAARAIDVYGRVFGARVLEKFALEDGSIVHAALAIGDGVLAITDEAPQFNNVSPEALGGTAVLLQLAVDDPDAVAERLVAEGGRVIFPVADQFYGKREGRVADPFGHVWQLSKELEKLTEKEIQRRMDAWAR